MRIPGALLLLSFGAGATDAFAFLSLKRIFTANMTGNLILIGLFDRADYAETVIGASIAIAGFVMALGLGFRHLRRTAMASSSRSGALEVLTAIAAIQCALFALWLVTGTSPGIMLRCVLIGASAAAMALQAVAARGVAPETGLSTTYVTGTITSLMQDIFDGKQNSRVLLRLGTIFALVAGAFAGAACIHVSDRLGPLLPAVAALFALLLVRGASVDSSSSR